MAPGFLYLTLFLALLYIVCGSPYGNIGCHFSPVCTPEEICADDNLFGSCISLDSSHIPYYDLDSRGLRKLKNGIKFLLDEGFEWRDKYSQGILGSILYPYQHEYSQSEFYNDAYNNAREPRQNQDLQPSRLFWDDNNIKKTYPGRFKKYAYKDSYVPSDVYQPRATVSDLVEEYVALMTELQQSRQHNLLREFDEYYAQYLRLLEKYNSIRGEGYTGYIDEEGDTYDDLQNDIDDKMEQVQEYLQKIFSDKFNNDGSFVDGAWVESTSGQQVQEEGIEQGQYTVESSQEHEGAQEEDTAKYFVESNMDREEAIDGDDTEEDAQEWFDLLIPGGSSSLSDDSAFPSDSDDRFKPPSLLGEQLIPFLSKADKEEWDHLTDKEKDEVLTEVFDAVGINDGDDTDTVNTDIFQPSPEDGDLIKEKDDEKKEDSDTKIDEASQKDLYLTGQIGDVEKKSENIEKVTVVIPFEEDTTTKTSKPETTPPATSGYVYIALEDKISQKDAETLVNNLAYILNVAPDTFSRVSSHGSEITFFVNPNEQKMSPAVIAASAAQYGKTLEDVMQVNIKETRVGQVVEDIGEPLKDEDNTALIVLTVILSLCILVILLVVVSIYCIRRRGHFQAKLKGLSDEEIEPEAKSDYQDLCRQRMATKNSDKPEPLSRISSIAQSEGAQPSPSSRSSTSSWSEEPVQSNMDISTGHVVLSYMEDHLKNEDRLSKEWEALCTYEPDSTSTTAGQDPKSISRNRFSHSLPYDHSRIILNENVSANGSDYINANAIVDTDPKAPAYIATQAPLPATLGDFWQMVWEQGSVVLVNLTHLSEREILKTPYWPNKGSAIYHIYELHLVSEHVWCDDYLVRSFYLKNLETQETRTVTQFHFLSWTKDGVPESPKALLEFRRKVNKSFRGRQCPIIVHCNDGIGRTGTYILVDLVLSRMAKGAKEIDIAATLEHIRDHRESLVRTKEQFEFALTAVAEEVNAILKALPQ